MKNPTPNIVAKIITNLPPIVIYIPFNIPLVFHLIQIMFSEFPLITSNENFIGASGAKSILHCRFKIGSHSLECNNVSSG